MEDDNLQSNIEKEFDENIIATFGPSISFGSSAPISGTSEKSNSIGSYKISSIDSTGKESVEKDDKKLHVQIPRSSSDHNSFLGETPQIGSLTVRKPIPNDIETPLFFNNTENKPDNLFQASIDNNRPSTDESFQHATNSNSANTSVSSLWNHKMASFISVTENTWDKPISATQTGTYTLSSDSTDEWIYDKAADAITNDDTEHAKEKPLPEEIRTKPPPLPPTQSQPPIYTDVAKITPYDTFDRKEDSSISAIEMEIKPQRIAELEKKVAEKIKLGNTNSIISHNDRVKRSCIAPPGKLGVFIDTTKCGPVIHNVKESSPMFGMLFTGDQIVAIDDRDVRSMTAAAVTKIMTKRAGYNRKITVLSDNRCV